EQEAVGPPPQHRPALRRAADRDRRAPDDRGVGELDERAAGPDRDLRTGGVMSEKNPRPDHGVRTDDAERPGTGPAESGSWSSKPEVDGKRAAVPSLGLRGTLLFLWRQLTSMQTALVLLMLLAVAAIPGSLYPQRSVNPALTEQFLEENGRWGEILDT